MKFLVTYTVKTIAPLKDNLPNLGTAPDQNVVTPSCLKMLTAHFILFP